jgi:PncC family amidohydrolase
MPTELQSAAGAVAAAAHGRGRTVAAAESVTAGLIATSLAAAPDASEWFVGSVVAYRTATKREVLGVRAERVISAECAREMTTGVLQLTGADLAVAVTGVGGPDPEEDQPAGTVIICVGTRRKQRLFEHLFEGAPEEIVELSALHALQHLTGAALELRRGAPS